MRTAALLAVLSGIAFGQSNRTACSIAPDVEIDNRSLPSMSDLSKSWEERYAPRRALAKRYVTDWPLQFILQAPILLQATMGREWDLAIEHYRALPDRTLGELLEARLLSSVQRKKTRAALDRILGQAKDSPWAHLAMLEWAADPRNGDQTIAEREFETFRQLCPRDQFVFRYLGAVRHPEKLRRHVEALRNAIEAAKERGLEEEELEMLRTAWTFEQITYGRDHRDEFRKGVRSDLESLRDHPIWDSDLWSFLLSMGYSQILDESAAIKSLPDEVLAHAPNSGAAYSIRKERWERENPPPPRPTPANPQDGQIFTAADQAYSARYTAFSLALIKEYWGQGRAGFDARNLITSEHVPPEMAEALADLALSTAERFPDQSNSTPPLQVLIAEAYVSRKVRLEQVPALLEKGIEQSENQEKYSRDSDAFERMPGDDGASETRKRVREVLIEHAIVTGKIGRARELLNEFRRELDQSRPLHAGGRLAAQWRADQLMYGVLASRAGIDVPRDNELLSLSPSVEERYPVAHFEAKDFSGKTWSLAGLQGKVTYIVVWRVGCGGPCQAALQGVQQLYERWKGRGDRAVLAISVDENPAIAESFMKENEYSFPMIYGAEIADKFVPGSAWPTAWLIDPQGRRYRRSLPPPSDQTIPRIEELADHVAETQ